jgi:hypothetical protein
VVSQQAKGTKQMSNNNAYRELLAAVQAEKEDRESRAYEGHVQDALDAADLAVAEYHNGDRRWAEQWLLAAFEAGKAVKRWQP